MRYELKKPELLNGDELQAELQATNLYVVGDLVVFDSELEIETVKKILQNHKPSFIEKDKEKAAAKAALLERLGITEEEARLLLGGN